MSERCVVTMAAAIDWLTLATFKPKAHNELVGTMRLCCTDVHKARPSRKMQYTGMLYPDAFHGTGQQGDESHYLAQVWGGAADLVGKMVSESKALADVRCTRMDVQCTVPIPEELDLATLGFVLRELPASEWDCRGQKPSITIMSSDGGRETVYVYSRKSEEFCRMYIKDVDGELWLRVEFEYKGEKARQAWGWFLRSGERALGDMLKGSLSRFPAAAGLVVLAVQDVVGSDCGERLTRFVKDPTLESTMAWLENSVEPAFERLATTEMRSHLKRLLSRLEGIMGEV